MLRHSVQERNSVDLSCYFAIFTNGLILPNITAVPSLYVTTKGVARRSQWAACPNLVPALVVVDDRQPDHPSHNVGSVAVVLGLVAWSPSLFAACYVAGVHFEEEVSAMPIVAQHGSTRGPVMLLRRPRLGNLLMSTDPSTVPPKFSAGDHFLSTVLQSEAGTLIILMRAPSIACDPVGVRVR
jgi:hypothetical protein